MCSGATFCGFAMRVMTGGGVAVGLCVPPEGVGGVERLLPAKRPERALNKLPRKLLDAGALGLTRPGLVAPGPYACMHADWFPATHAALRAACCWLVISGVPIIPGVPITNGLTSTLVGTYGSSFGCCGCVIGALFPESLFGGCMIGTSGGC